MLLIKNGHVKTMVGEDIIGGCVLIGDDGKIAAVGADIEAPESATEYISLISSLFLASMLFLHISSLPSPRDTPTLFSLFSTVDRARDSGSSGESEMPSNI